MSDLLFAARDTPVVDTQLRRLRNLAPLAMLWIATAVLLRDTFAGMWRIWSSSDTYVHGFVVLPITVWLLWRRRAEILATPLRPAPTALIAVIAALLAWLAGSIVSADVVTHAAVITALIATCALVGGWALVRSMAFPLAFMYFAVPIGEGLVPHLMELTADVATFGLQVFGVPVFRQGMLISTPSGDFAVERACSGIRYLTATLMVGTLFAYLFYRSAGRRILFVAICVIVPVIANALRALGIILLAYATDNRVATGVDHIIYGWVFFAAVLLGLLALGRAWSESDAESAREVPGISADAAPRWAAMWFWSGVVCVAVVGVSYAATTADRQLAERAADHNLVAAVPISQAGWRGPFVAEPQAQAQFANAVASQVVSYAGPGGNVELAVYRFAAERAGSELWQPAHQLFDASQWRWLTEETRWVELAADVRLAVSETIVRRGRDERVIWSWRTMSGRVVRNASDAKLQALRDLLRHGPGTSAAILLSAPADGSYEVAHRLLHDFTVNHYTQLTACVSDNSQLTDGCIHSGHRPELASRNNPP